MIKLHFVVSRWWKFLTAFDSKYFYDDENQKKNKFSVVFLNSTKIIIRILVNSSLSLSLK